MDRCPETGLYLCHRRSWSDGSPEGPRIPERSEPCIHQYSGWHADVVGWPPAGAFANGSGVWAGFYGGDVPAFGGARLSALSVWWRTRRSRVLEGNTSGEISGPSSSR